MEPYNGNRYSNPRNQNRQNFRRMGGPGMTPAGFRTNEGSCPCGSGTAQAESAARGQNRRPGPGEAACDNGVSAADRTCSISHVNDPMFGMPLAMAYVPWQRFGDTYEICRPLQVGTIFPELDLPFRIGRCAQCR